MEPDMAVSFPSLYSVLRDAVDTLVEELYTEKVTHEDFVDNNHHGELNFETMDTTRKYASYNDLYGEIHKALTSISDAYSDNKLKTETKKDLFEDPVYRCAYVYLYFASHSHLVKRFLMEGYLNSAEFRKILDHVLHSGMFLKACAVGGGPGTDIIGLMLFLRQLDIYKKVEMTPSEFKSSRLRKEVPLQQARPQHPLRRNFATRAMLPYPAPPRPRGGGIGWGGRVLRERNAPVMYQNFPEPPTIPPPKPVATKPCRVRAIVLDNCRKWSETCTSTFPMLRPLWGNLAGNVDKVAYGQADFTSPGFIDTECTALEFADLVTMVKVVSAIAGNEENSEKAREAIWSIFSRLKPGCLILFIDNSGGGSTELVKDVARSVRLKELYSAPNVECKVPSGENKSPLSFYHDKFNYVPQSKAKVTAIVWRK